MIRVVAWTLFMCALSFYAPLSARAVTIPTVPVGNLGNANDPLTGNLYGGVASAYRIGTTEVTNAQYAAFLNEKAKSDPLGLYNMEMDFSLRGGITQIGSSPNFSYALKTNMADKPVNYVSWYDSIRFSNWLNNGQGTGDTETGAYTLLGGTPIPSNDNLIARNGGATWFLPNEDEWYKAAYHQPAAQGGDSDDYWLYPTANNSPPTIATANGVGDISNPGPNVANYNNLSAWYGDVTTVGSAGPLSESFYGTLDQGGNVTEWNEALLEVWNRGLRGGQWVAPSYSMLSSSGGSFAPGAEWPDIGFRVATVPEPSSLVLAACAALGLVFANGRRRRRERQFA